MKETVANPPDDPRARILVQAAGFIFYLLAVQALIAVWVGVEVYLSSGAAQDLLLPITSLLLAGCYLGVGYHLRRYKVWARNYAFAFAAVSLFAFPIGTVLGALIVLCIERANRSQMFSQRSRPAPQPPPAFSAEEDAPVLRFEPQLAAEEAR